MNYILQNAEISVTIASLGAEIISVVKNGKERIWQNPTGEWSGHAPLLFPVSGRCRLTVDGVEYPIGMHGFARKTEFALEEQGDDFVKLSVQTSEQTKQVYPYDFKFTVTYRLTQSKLTISFDVENPSNEPIYFACGSHESYALENNVDSYEIEFEQEEARLIHCPHGATSGRLTGEEVDFGTVKTLPLPLNYLQNGNTLIFKGISSRAVTLKERNGKSLAKVSFEGFENLLLWRAENAKYICIEPWTNLPDPENTPDIEFKTKAGVMEVAPKTVKTLTRSIEYF